MSIENRIKHLQEEHRKLDKKIAGLESTGVFDDAECVFATHFKREFPNEL